MNPLSLVETELKDFSGIAPLFPLPNVVLFPHALLPLHIFEPRYRQMTADTLEGERLIAMSLLRPGWEQLSPAGLPPIHRIVGLGKIIAHERLEDGRYYLVLRGLARARLLTEQQVDLPYRIGQLEVCQEIETDSPTFDRQQRASDLVSAFAQVFPKIKIDQLFVQDIAELPLGTVCDILLGSMPLPSELSQQFLDNLQVDSRSQMLLDLLHSALQGMTGPRRRTYPPTFSQN